MTSLTQLAEDYQRVETAIGFLEANFSRQPELGEVAAAVGLSAFHFQRLFSRWVGISPKRFLQYLTKEYAKSLLAGRTSLLDATYDAGLSGPGRLHDLFVHCEAVTPGQYKARGLDLNIGYGFHPSPFGQCLVASTDRGICYLAFVRDNDRRRLLDDLSACWPEAAIRPQPERTGQLVARVFGAPPPDAATPLHLFIRGTNFQIKVWEALLKIPFGTVVTYQDLAGAIGHPAGARAVGNAVGRNPVSFVIPCHRVIRKAGDFGNYGGGRQRKKAILGWEAAKAGMAEHSTKNTKDMKKASLVDGFRLPVAGVDEP